MEKFSKAEKEDCTISGHWLLSINVPSPFTSPRKFIKHTQTHASTLTSFFLHFLPPISANLEARGGKWKCSWQIKKEDHISPSPVSTPSSLNPWLGGCGCSPLHWTRTWQASCKFTYDAGSRGGDPSAEQAGTACLSPAPHFLQERWMSGLSAEDGQSSCVSVKGQWKCLWLMKP